MSSVKLNQTHIQASKIVDVLSALEFTSNEKAEELFDLVDALCEVEEDDFLNQKEADICTRMRGLVVNFLRDYYKAARELY